MKIPNIADFQKPEIPLVSEQNYMGEKSVLYVLPYSFFSEKSNKCVDYACPEFLIF